MSQYVAAYDISDNRQRSRVSHVLDRFGERVQRSVYVLWLDTDDVKELRRDVGILLSESDRFDLFPIATSQYRQRCSWGQMTAVSDPVIVIDD